MYGIIYGSGIGYVSCCINGPALPNDGIMPLGAQTFLLPSLPPCTFLSLSYFFPLSFSSFPISFLSFSLPFIYSSFVLIFFPLYIFVLFFFTVYKSYLLYFFFLHIFFVLHCFFFSCGSSLFFLAIIIFTSFC